MGDLKTQPKTRSKESLWIRVILWSIAVTVAVVGVGWLYSQLGAEQPSTSTAEQALKRDIFGNGGTTCYELYDFPGEIISGPPCAVPTRISLDQTPDGEWCVNITFLAQRQEDIDAIRARDLDLADELELVDGAPYFEHQVLGWGGKYCGEFVTYSINRRNNPDDPEVWSFRGPTMELRAAVEAATQQL